MPKLDFIKIEEEMLQFWAENDIYKKAKEKNVGKEKWYFLDGPPYTSGKVHIGTAWNKSLKDMVLRFKRMTGHDVWDRAGYDMHGLPTENATQKKLGLKTKEDIQDYGVDKFITECKQLCIDNMEAMNKDFERLGVWMDFKNAYQSIKKNFMEGEWWLIKRAHEEGRLYQGLRTMTWCPITESALAKHELEYKTVKEDSVFVKFKVKDTEDEYLVIWTTTPWTIPLNLAIMVNPDVEYVKIEVDGEKWWVAGVLAGIFMGSVVGKKYKVLETKKGSELEGVEYVHPFYDELKHHFDRIKEESPKAFTVLLSSEFVDTTGGSGLVHCAPGCGPEDYEIGYRNGIKPFNELKPNGVYNDTMGKLAGLVAKKEDDKFIKAIDEVGALIATNEVEHEYPHDWRYHEPVIFRTTKQWFFKVEDLVEDMIKENNGIKWVPQSAFNAFDSWLKNLRDNSISKQRFWGTPIPIWANTKDATDYIVIGSAAELKELSGVEVDDLHISSVDKIIFQKDGKTYKRIPDILDVWVDAGTTSWNCLDYPKNIENFQDLFPAEFILEGKDQIRGWFNLLMVASMIALKKPSFKSVYMHGFVQDAQGRKMSKSLGNYILPEEVISKHGSEVLRFYMISGANPGLDMNYNFEDMQTRLRNLGVLWNVHNYVINLVDEIPDKVELGIEEKYIISKLNSTIKNVTEAFIEIRLNEVPKMIEELFLELSRTYIQFVRDKEDKGVVAYTLFRVLDGVLKLLAPVCPMLSEKMYLDLKEKFGMSEDSIHFCQWPEADESLIDKDLEEGIAIIKNVIGSVLNAREKAQLGVRWPLSEVIVETKDDKVSKAVSDYGDLIKLITNVKMISLEKLEVKLSVKPNYKTIGPAFGKDSAKVIAHLTTQSAETIIEHLDKKDKYSISIDDVAYDLSAEHLVIEKEVPEFYAASDFSHGSVYLNKNMNPELEAEGFSRELTRRVQNLRKNNELNKEDSINLHIACESHLGEMFLANKEQIMQKVGAKELIISNRLANISIKSDEKVKGKQFSIAIEKV